ncbi:MAG: 16S rRNA (guanine(527)-N(7))-methyltransferase RsmG [Steroidobacteraceae bacterium]
MSAAGERAALLDGARALGVLLPEAAAERLLRLLDELVKWNAAYNLTSIRQRGQMLTRHLLDSLAIHGDLEGERIADVGTGAGFPGVPLAVASPERRFTLIDSNGKKIRFVRQAIRSLELANVEAVQARAEDLQPAAPFDSITARACAPLPELLKTVAGLAGPGTRVLAMKGRYPQDEIAAVRPPWQIVEARPLEVPGLDEERHLVLLTRS